VVGGSHQTPNQGEGWVFSWRRLRGPGVNGSGKSTLLRIMAGQETEFVGEAWAAEGVSVGYLPQEPVLDETKDVTGNVMEGVAAKKAKLDRYNELAMNYSD